MMSLATLRRLAALAGLLAALYSLTGCVIYSVADTAVSTTVSVAGGAVDLIVPEGDDEDED